MRRYVVPCLIFLLISIVFVSIFYSRSKPASIAFEKQRGVCWVAGPHPINEKDFLPLVENNIEWINQTPFAFQRDYNTSNLVFYSGDRVWWGERDIGLEVTTSLAKKHGIKSILKPHIWITRPTSGKWRAQIEMDDEKDWQTWFENYNRFILHHARLAEKNGIEIFCIGTELHITVKQREQDWRALIAKVRRLYSGKLTYAANWYEEYQDVAFWDKLDYIGIQAYFPLSNDKYPTLQQLVKAWQPYIQEIQRIQQKFQKPVIFTEIGYRSMTNSASKPWEWIRPFRGNPAEADLKLQADCYEAFFRSFWNKEWFAGVYFWKWYPGSRRVTGGGNSDFTPQDKPAEKILAKWFDRNRN